MKELLKSISKSEWCFVGLISLILIILTGLPYLYAWLVAPAGFVYNGLASLTPADNPVYYSYINQVKSGQFLVKDLFTTEPQAVGLLNIFWLAIGLLAKILFLPPALVFHLSRLLLIPVFNFVLYGFVSLFFSEPGKRKFCLFFLLFSAGLGAYSINQISSFDLASQPGYWTPNDIWIPESIVFLTLYKTPHFIASLGLMITIFSLMIFSFRQNRLVYSAIAGLLALVYFNFHPFYIPMIFGTLGLYLLILIFRANKILWRPLSHFLLLIIVSSPSIIYHFWTLAHDPVLQQRALQNVTIAPPFIFILIGYGFLWPLAIAGIIWLFRRRQFNDYFLFLLSWLVFSVVLVNLPFQFQSRYTQGLHLPLAIFSVVALFFLAEKFLTPANLKKYPVWLDNKVMAAILFLVLFMPSIVFNLTRDIYYFTFRPPAVAPYFYLSAASLEAMKQLANLPAGQNVLANDLVDSLFIPGQAAQAVYLAHSIETIDYPVKIYYFQWFFYSDRAEIKKHQFLLDQNIDYLFFNFQNQKPGYFNPTTKSYLQLVYQNSQVAVYQVLK